MVIEEWVKMPSIADMFLPACSIAGLGVGEDWASQRCKWFLFEVVRAMDVCICGDVGGYIGLAEQIQMQFCGE